MIGAEKKINLLNLLCFEVKTLIAVENPGFPTSQIARIPQSPKSTVAARIASGF